MLASRASMSNLLTAFTDPFQFHAALQGLELAPEDLPGLTRDCRHTGAGC